MMGFKKKARDRRQKKRLEMIAEMQKKLVKAVEAQGGEVIKHHIVLDEDNNPISVPHFKLSGSGILPSPSPEDQVKRGEEFLFSTMDKEGTKTYVVKMEEE